MAESHFYQALKQVAGTNPPEFMLTITAGIYINMMSDDECDKLQIWALDESNLPWCTGMGVIDAALALVMDAEGNANIKKDSMAEHDLCLSHGKHMFVAFGTPAVIRCNWCGTKESKGDES